MAKVAIVTDSNCGLTQAQAKEMGIYMLPMTFLINDKMYREELDLSQEAFYEMIQQPGTSVSTSQPSPAELMEMWDRVLKENDSLVHIPMSSGLSNSCQTALMVAEDYNGKVEVVNNQRISVTMRRSLEDAKVLVEQGWTAKQIKEKLEKEKANSSIYIMVDTLDYLKKGGRVTPAAALLGSVFNIKPILQIQGEKLDAYAKTRGIKKAKRTMIEAIEKDMQGRFKWFVDKGEADINYSYSSCNDPEEVKEWVEELREAFPGYNIVGEPLSLVIGCHIGPGSLAVTVSRKITPENCNED